MIRFFQKGGVKGGSHTPSSVNITGANEKVGGDAYAEWYRRTYGNVNPNTVGDDNVVSGRRYSPDRVYVGQSFPGNRSVYARKVGGGLEPHNLSDFAPFNPAYKTGRFMNNMVNHAAEPFVRTGKVLGDAVELTGHGFANGARTLNKALRMAYTDTPAYQGGGTVLNSNLNEREREIISNQALFNAGVGGVDYGLGDVSKYYVPVQPYSESNYLPNNVGYVPIDASLAGHGEEVLPQANPTPLSKAQLKAWKNKVRHDIKELRRIPSKYRNDEMLEARKQELKMIRKGINNPSYKVYNPADYKVSSS